MIENPAARFFEHARRTPGALALACDGRDLSYAELATEAAIVARQVRALSVTLQRPARIALFARKSREAYAALLGTLAGGGTYVALHPHHPERFIESAVAQACPDARIGAPASGTCAIPPLRELGESSFHAPPLLPADHPAYILFTSGTTGAPKGVVIPVRALNAFRDELRRIYAFTPDDRFAQFAELTFDVSLLELFGAWDSGASLHVVPDAWAGAPDRFIRERALTVWSSTPSLIPVLRRAGRLEAGGLPSLRTSIFLGEPLTATDADAWALAAPHSVLDNHYGPTETTVACTWYRVPRIGASRLPGRDTLCIGRPYSGTVVEVVSPAGAFLPDGERGELAVAGDQVALGYLGMPVSERFVTLEHPTLGRGRWYLTGDLGLRDRDGNLHVLGRRDLQVKVLGHRLELEGIEAAIRDELQLGWVVAVPWPIENCLASGLVAFVGQSPFGDWRSRLERRLPRSAIPSRLIPLATPPLTSHGKLDRAALANLLSESAEARPAPPPAPAASRTERWLAALWSEILGIAQIPFDRTFAELGGDSASVIRVMAAIWDEFGEAISPDDFRQDPTVTGMARVLDAHRQAGS